MRDEIEAIFDRVQWLTARQAAPGICIQILACGEHFATAAGVQTVRGDAAMTDDTRFPMGCIAKSLMALSCADLHLSGRLDIQAPCTEYLPELHSPTQGPAPSLADLLSHSGGYVEPQIPAPFQELTWDCFVPFFQNREQAFQPGAVWSYTQTGHAIIARVLERVVGRPLLDHVKDNILDGLGIGPDDIRSRMANLRGSSSLHVFSPRAGRYEAVKLPRDSGFFRESISDAPLSAAELLVLGKALSERRVALVDPEAVGLAHQARVEIEPQAASSETETIPEGYGLGVGRYGSFSGLTGSFLGSTCAIRSCSSRAVVVVIAMNAWAPGVRDRLLSRLMAVVGDYEPPSQRVAFAYPADRWVGDYEGLSLGSGVLTVRRSEDGVQCFLRRAQGEQKIVLAPGMEGLYSVRSGGPASVGFHLEPESNAPYVRVGSAAYRKVMAH